jgi:hypothetical protein
MKNVYCSDKVDEERFYEIDYFTNWMKENDIKKLTVYKGKIDHGTGYFYCKEFMEVGEVGEGCGNECPKYKPNNGKNGRCYHYGYVYSPTEKKITIKL